MIELISENEVALVLDPDTRIRMEWNSPFFDTEVIKGDIVYWFDIPLNPINIKELGHANTPGISGKARIINFRLILLGTISMTGKLIVSTFEKKFRCAFTTNTLQEFREIKLNAIAFGSDINMGTTTQNVIDHAAGKNSVSYPATNYVFPVIENTELYGSSNPAFLGYINNWDFLNTEFFINSLPAGDDEDLDLIANKYTLSPQFFLQFILDKLFTEMGLDHFGEFVTGTEYQQLLLFNAFCLDDNDDEYWITGVNGRRDASSGANPAAIYFLGDVTHGSEMNPQTYPYGFNITQKGWYQVTLKVKASMADPLTDLLIRVTGGSFTNDVLILAADAENTEIVENTFVHYYPEAEEGENIFCLCSSDWDLDAAEFEVVNMSETNLNRYLKDITISNHIPAIAINEFLNKLRELWQMAIIIESGNAQAELFLLKDLFTAGSSDFTDRIRKGEKLESINKKTINVDFDWDTDDNFLDTAQYNDRGDFDQYIDLPFSRNIADIATMNPSNNIFKVNYIDFENIWQRFTDVIQKTIYGTGEDIIDIPIGMHPAFMTGFIYADVKTKSEFLFALARVQKQGKSKMFNSENDLDPILKLTNWFELGDFEHTDETTKTYPFATSHNIDSLGAPIGDYSMFLIGTDSIGKIYHEPWFNWLQNTETFSFRAGKNFGAASLLELLQLIRPQKGVTVANQKRWMFIESIKYLPNIITAEISMQGLELVEIKATKQAFDIIDEGS